MLTPPRRHGPTRSPAHAFDDLVVGISFAVDGRTAAAEHAVRAVLAELRVLAPEETTDIGATLPAEMRALWTAVGDGSRRRESI
jgi:uncharacterized protein (DUF2267 family)